MIPDDDRRRDVYACVDPETDWTQAQQIELCTNDHKCRAEPDQHDPGCPKEQQLQEELGF